MKSMFDLKMSCHPEKFMHFITDESVNLKVIPVRLPK